MSLSQAPLMEVAVTKRRRVLSFQKSSISRQIIRTEVLLLITITIMALARHL